MFKFIAFDIECVYKYFFVLNFSGQKVSVLPSELEFLLSYNYNNSSDFSSFQEEITRKIFCRGNAIRDIFMKAKSFQRSLQAYKNLCHYNVVSLNVYGSLSQEKVLAISSLIDKFFSLYIIYQKQLFEDSETGIIKIVHDSKKKIRKAIISFKKD